MGFLVLDPPIHFRRIKIFMERYSNGGLNYPTNTVRGVSFDFTLKDEVKEILSHYCIEENIYAIDGDGPNATNLNALLCVGENTDVERYRYIQGKYGCKIEIVIEIPDPLMPLVKLSL